jgi:nickel-dependent lactate racemase
VVGNIEPHQFQGFSGGVKSAAIGLAGRATINHNHAMMVHPDSRLGNYKTNPARQDVGETGEIIGIHFALNGILNQDKKIVRVLAGDPKSVLESGITIAREICQVAVDSLYDFVIASPGGHPKDINLYQSQKGLAHASMITRSGGTIILIAACPEGTGSRGYEEWIRGIKSHESVIERFSQTNFRVGPHKAFQIARDATRVNLFTLSEIPYNKAKKLLLNPIVDLQHMIDQTLSNLPLDAKIAIMPRASSTIPDTDNITLKKD